MATKSPVAATLAATHRHEGCTTKLNDLQLGVIDESVKASAAKHSPLEHTSSYINLDTTKDQQIETKPVPAPVTQTGTITNPSSTAHGSVGDGSF